MEGSVEMDSSGTTAPPVATAARSMAARSAGWPACSGIFGTTIRSTNLDNACEGSSV